MPRRQFRQGAMCPRAGFGGLQQPERKFVAADALGELRSFEPETDMNFPGEMVYFIIRPRMDWHED